MYSITIGPAVILTDIVSIWYTNLLCRDYRAIPALDRYDRTHMDEEDYEGMDIDERMAAEAALRRRDKERGIAAGRMRRGLLYGECNYIIT